MSRGVVKKHHCKLPLLGLTVTPTKPRFGSSSGRTRSQRSREWQKGFVQPAIRDRFGHERSPFQGHIAMIQVTVLIWL